MNHADLNGISVNVKTVSIFALVILLTAAVRLAAK